MRDRIIDMLRRLFGGNVAKAPVTPNKTTASHSRRQEDMSAEAQLARFLDTYLYARFPKSDAFSKIERVHDKERQLVGVDVEFLTTKGQTFAVDEKAQLYYLNKDLPTFAFELSICHEGRDTIGWLCDPRSVTDLYMLIWPYATQDTPKGITWERFTKAECLLISKRKLKSWLAHMGLTDERLQADAKAIRREKTIGRVKIRGMSGVYYYASDPDAYAEAPINLIVSKTHLIKLAQRRYIVTPNGIEMT